METEAALDAFGALSQRTRLETLRLLVRAGESGLAAGDVARAVGVPHNTLSAHLAVLSAAGLVISKRQGRTILYFAHFGALRDLVAFLMRDCCAGVPGNIGDLSPSATACFKGECV